MSLQIGLNPIFDGMAPSPTLHINQAVASMWSAGETVYHMGFGESRFPVHPLLERALNEHAHTKSYLPALGLAELRDAVARYYSQHLGVTFRSDQVIVGPGSKALIYALQMSLQAQLFLPSPSWVSYAPQAQLLGKPVTYIPSQVDGGYQLNLTALDRMIPDPSVSQSLLIINSPNNPTGQMLDRGFLLELAEFCRERGLLVISDEIYFRVDHGDEPHVSLARFYPEGTFVLGGLSKHLSLGGWRFGVALVPDSEQGMATLDAMEIIASEIWSAVAAPVQHAAITAYSGTPEIEQYIVDCSIIHGRRTRFLAEELGRIGFTCTTPHGGFYLTANCNRWAGKLASRDVNTSADLAMYLLENHHIASLPCDAFGLPPETLSLRLATSYLDMETDRKAETLLNLYRGGINPDAFMNEAHHPNTHACLAAFKQFADSLKQ
ncbi:MAG: aminotransferase class I/II-fold pyridoxal phosphate-dependent enzyme [Xanthomonadales bacterium]|nr:aminotransferase class I/II-fold pyridoxal phosphate-dependent enzyme [Xanthomonadales bacterium]